MKVAVLVKRVPDTASELRVAEDGKSVAVSGLKYVMSPYDEHAVELAIQLKEASGAEVVIVSAGSADTKDAIRSALAMGADSGLLVVTPDGLSGKAAARLLARALSGLSADLILAGKQAVDDDGAQVPERVAEILGIPHASVITRFELNGAAASVDREIDGGQYSFEVPLPALFTLQKGINTPRYPTLPNIMKAKKKEIKEVTPESLGGSGAELASGITVESMYLPRKQRLGKVLSGDTPARVHELVRVLREEEKVL